MKILSMLKPNQDIVQGRLTRMGSWTNNYVYRDFTAKSISLRILVVLSPPICVLTLFSLLGTLNYFELTSCCIIPLIGAPLAPPSPSVPYRSAGT